jgi:uncharacterized protein YehS (DUF1456 family)
MTNNDVLIRLRYALNITDLKVLEIFRLAGCEMERAELEGIFKREDEEGHVRCPDRLAGLFLTGLIAWKRGPRPGAEGSPEESAPGSAAEAAGGPARREASRSEESPRGPLTNNDILKRIRVALALKDEDIVAIMGLAGVAVSKAEVNALFRKRGGENYRECGDQFLRNFLAGLTKKYRP